jgi:hypothetical protein
MAEIIAAGNTAAVSADFTLADAESVTISLDIDTRYHNPRVEVQIKNGANYITFDEVNTNHNLVRVLQAPGTFRIRRPAQQASFAVHKTP